MLEIAVQGDQRLAAFCAVLVFCGSRVSEALAVHRYHVDREQRVIRLRTLKRRNGEIVWRAVPVPEELIDMLFDLPGGAHTPIFPWSRSTAWRQVTRLMSAANIKGVHASPKGLRHRFGIVAASELVPVALIQRWMGHSKLENTLIYLQAVGAEERTMAERLWHHPRWVDATGLETPDGVGPGGSGSAPSG